MASSSDNEDSKELNPRKNLEEEYLDYEAKVCFLAVDVTDLFIVFYFTVYKMLSCC
jgi:hypothetical protein